MSKKMTAAEAAKNVTARVLWELDTIPGICARIRPEGKASFEIGNWMDMAMGGTQLLGIRLRHEGNEAQAQDALRLAHGAAVQALDAFAYYEAAGVRIPHVGLMYHAELSAGFIMAWLAQDEALAQRCAALTHHPLVTMTSGRGAFGAERDLTVRMYAAVVERDAQALALWRGRYDEEVRRNAKRDPFWSKYRHPYPTMMTALLQDDAIEMDAQLAEASRLFAVRSSDKQTDALSSHEGPPPMNEILIDYQATALGVLALSRGLKLTFESPAIPIHTIKGWPPLA